MGISIVKYKKNGNTLWGILSGEKISQLVLQPPNLMAIIEAPQTYLIDKNLEKETFDFQQVEILAPVSGPLRVLCQGVNYASHRKESGLSSQSSGNVLFTKDSSSITGAFSPVIRPKDCQCLDYEVELGLIIRKDITQPVKITEANLHEYIAGLVLANDFSARDLQYKDDYAQWYKGKSCRTLLPLGPVFYLLDKEEFNYLNNLTIQLWVNDQLRQEANTSQLIFKPAETLTEISEFQDLSAGDLLLTGTPGGVVIKAPGKFLQGIATWLLSNEKKVNVLRKKKADYLQDNDIVKTKIYSADGKIDLRTQLNKIISYGF